MLLAVLLGSGSSGNTGKCSADVEEEVPLKKLSVSAAWLAPAFLLLAGISCGGDKTPPVTGPPVATSLAANSATSINGVAGAAVTPPPSVIVKDQNGSPMGGVTVAFAVVSGGGSVSGETVTTNAAGIATVGSWTLGPVSGANVLNATSGTLTAVAFTATSSAGAAGSIAKNAGDNQTAVAGSAVPIRPSVLVKDANGNPKSDVSVTFAVGSGGGSVTGATVTTNASGIATVGSWTLGPVAGANVLNATSGTLGAVAFAATSTTGSPASVTRNAGDNQTTQAGTAVPIPPSVSVKDANGNPTSSVSVTFAVVSGGGSVTGATAVTNSAGVATLGSWTLGNSAGPNSLSATATGLPSVTFTATATPNPCTVRSTHTFGTSSSGLFSSADCKLSDGSFVDFYTVSVPQAGAYFFRESAAFDTYLLLGMADGTKIGENDDEPGAGTNSAIKALLPAGDYLLAPGTLDPDITGDYAISSTTAPTDVANCEDVFVVRNITTTQNLATTDCNLAGAGATPIYYDGYFIFLTAGTSVTINMTSTALDSYLQLLRFDGQVMAQNDNIDSSTSDSRITFTVTQTNYYAIFARSASTTAVGAYTLTIQ